MRYLLERTVHFALKLCLELLAVFHEKIKTNIHLISIKLIIESVNKSAIFFRHSMSQTVSQSVS